MTTGSLCFTEILKSWKSCSSKSDASQTADSTSASGVALPYLASSRGSSEPAFTPIRIETPAALAASAISLTLSSNCRMFPGLTRTPAHPASIAANTYFGWKWMSAMTGICDLRAMAGRASASSWLGHATRTMSQPAAVSSAICWRVALTSVVGVVVIDCTETGASPPTSTEPTLICRDRRRGEITGGGAAGRPRFTDIEGVRLRDERVGAGSRGGGSAAEADGSHDVGVDEQHRHADQQRRDAVGQRQRPGDVDPAGVRPRPEPRDLPPGALPEGPRDVAAVQGQQRDEVEDEEREVQRGDQQQQLREAVGERELDDVRAARARHLAGDATDADDADRAAGVALAAAERRLRD